ncbi:MAG: nuclear transport factor 2 family protein [Mucilaginibacter sp.]
MEQKSNKNIVTEFYRNVVRLRKSEMIADYVHENYIQHSPMGKDGREGLFEMVEFLKKLPPVEETTPSPIVNLIAEDDYVVAHLDIHFMGKHIRVIELFRVQHGLAAEHWDVTEEPTGKNEPVINIKGLINEVGLRDNEYIIDLYSKIDDVIIHHLIAVHAELKQAGKSTALFDIFKMKDRQITEHHYVKQVVPEKMMHNNGMF